MKLLKNMSVLFLMAAEVFEGKMLNATGLVNRVTFENNGDSFCGNTVKRSLSTVFHSKKENDIFEDSIGSLPRSASSPRMSFQASDGGVLMELSDNRTLSRALENFYFRPCEQREPPEEFYFVVPYSTLFFAMVAMYPDFASICCKSFQETTLTIVNFWMSSPSGTGRGSKPNTFLIDSILNAESYSSEEDFFSLVKTEREFLSPSILLFLGDLFFSRWGKEVQKAWAKERENTTQEEVFGIFQSLLTPFFHEKLNDSLLLKTLAGTVVTRHCVGLPPDIELRVFVKNVRKGWDILCKNLSWGLWEEKEALQKKKIVLEIRREKLSVKSGIPFGEKVEKNLEQANELSQNGSSKEQEKIQKLSERIDKITAELVEVRKLYTQPWIRAFRLMMLKRLETQWQDKGHKLLPLLTCLEELEEGAITPSQYQSVLNRNIDFLGELFGTRDTVSHKKIEQMYDKMVRRYAKFQADSFLESSFLEYILGGEWAIRRKVVFRTPLDAFLTKLARDSYFLRKQALFKKVRSAPVALILKAGQSAIAQSPTQPLPGLF